MIVASTLLDSNIEDMSECRQRAVEPGGGLRGCVAACSLLTVLLGDLPNVGSHQPRPSLLKREQCRGLVGLGQWLEAAVFLESLAEEGSRVTEGRRPVLGLPATATRLRRSSERATPPSNRTERTVVFRLNRNCLPLALNFANYTPDRRWRIRYCVLMLSQSDSALVLMLLMVAIP